MVRDVVPTWDVSHAVPGGQLLRDLRQQAGMSLLELSMRLAEADVHVDAAHLQRIETGRIKRPNADTVDAILTVGLNAPYRTRRNVLAAFGYRLPWTLPTESEVEEARYLFAQELEVTTWPAYLMDHGHRIWAWNRYGPRLLGLERGKAVPERYIGMTTLDFTFNPAFGMAQRIANPEVYLELYLRSFKIQSQPYAEDPWFRGMIDRAREWPRFNEIWDSLPDNADAMMLAGRNYPVAFRVPGYHEPLRFRIVLIYLSLDPRFQIIAWIPFGAHSMRAVAQWADEEGEV